MTDSTLRDLERRFRATGSVEDEAAWLSMRLRVGALPLGRLKLLGYLGHAAAVRVLSEECPGERLPQESYAEQPGNRIHQWVLGFADVCDPEERRTVTWWTLEALFHAGLTTKPEDDFEQEAPWSVMLSAAGSCSSVVVEATSPESMEERVREVIRGALIARLVGAPGTTPDNPRPYSPQQRFVIGEFLVHPRFGTGSVRVASRSRIEIEFEDGSRKQLGHGL